MKTCTVADCDRTHYGRGMCEAHYRRWRTNRTVEGPIHAKASQGTDPLIRIFGRLVEQDGCWVWPLSTHTNGYGQIMIDNRNWIVHRYVFTRFNGPIPAGMDVCHTCDVRLCAWPLHLWLGTRSENVRDMMSKGRGRGQFATH